MRSEEFYIDNATVATEFVDFAQGFSTRVGIFFYVFVVTIVFWMTTII